MSMHETDTNTDGVKMYIETLKLIFISVYTIIYGKFSRNLVFGVQFLTTFGHTYSEIKLCLAHDLLHSFHVFKVIFIVLSHHDANARIFREHE